MLQVPALFGVFDGHGGARVSHYASKHLLARVNQVLFVLLVVLVVVLVIIIIVAIIPKER